VAIAAGVKAAFAEAKLPGTPMVSPIRAAHPISPGEWMLCLKSSEPDQPRRYAAFFRDDTYVHVRLAVIIDRCGEETYASAPAR
jgi:hypothetical protein